eukprot:scaffold141807_cov32-Tisochrysis_lutea.AAC.2
MKAVQDPLVAGEAGAAPFPVTRSWLPSCMQLAFGRAWSKLSYAPKPSTAGIRWQSRTPTRTRGAVSGALMRRAQAVESGER